MLKLLTKSLKPFWWVVVLVVCLLFGQAMADLKLPNIMADIVSVGITQNGVEDPAPEALSPEAYDFIQIFATDEDQKILADGYTRFAAGSTRVPENFPLRKAKERDRNGTQVKDLYPNAVGAVYLRNAADLDALDSAFSRTIAAMVEFLRAMAEQNGTSIGGDSDAHTTELDLAKLYEFAPMLQQLPREAFADAQKIAADGEPSLQKATATVLCQSFLKELGVDVTEMRQGYIIRRGLFMLAVALLGGAATILVSFLSARLANGVARDLRSGLFHKVQSFSAPELDRFSIASLITRSTNDIQGLQMFLTFGTRFLVYAPIMAIGGIIMAFRTAAGMQWIIILACIVLFCFIGLMMAVAMPKFKAIQKFVDRLSLVFRENLTGMDVIRAFGGQKHEQSRFDVANEDLSKTNLFVNRVMVLMMPIMMLVMNGATILVIWFGGHQVAEAGLGIGDMMAYMQYAIQVIMSFLMLSMMFVFMPRAAVSAGRIQEVLETKLSIQDPANPQKFDETKRGVVEFKNVSFRYPVDKSDAPPDPDEVQEYAVEDISFVAEPGKTTALIGSTGAGKTTILSLLLRFYDPTEGVISVSGRDIRDVRQADLRAGIGYVPQKANLLTGTVESNLSFGQENLSADAMQTAVATAQAEEFAHFEDEIAQGGQNLSGGQKQRLSIARALAKERDILIFDDSFSALDFKTDAALRAALKPKTKASTVLIVAQRIATIMDAEQILVFDDGKIVGRGTHSDLLKSCPAYHEIASSQLSPDELGGDNHG